MSMIHMIFLMIILVTIVAIIVTIFSKKEGKTIASFNLADPYESEIFAYVKLCLYNQNIDYSIKPSETVFGVLELSVMDKFYDQPIEVLEKAAIKFKVEGIMPPQADSNQIITPVKAEAITARPNKDVNINGSAKIGGKVKCALCHNELISNHRMEVLYGQPVCHKHTFQLFLLMILAFIFDIIFILGATALIIGKSPTSLLENRDIYAPFYILFLLFRDSILGRSPGKFVFGLVVVKANTNKPAMFWTSFLRNLPILIPLATIYMFLQLAFLQLDGKRLGDGWSEARVVQSKYRQNFIPS